MQLFCRNSRVIKYLIQKYIILWLVKPNKTYNEFTAKKYRTINKLFFAEGVKVIQELLDSNFELEHLYSTQNDFGSIDIKEVFDNTN
jgi:tRNA G18 (ribose-2'-O)-methylase SpoU